MTEMRIRRFPGEVRPANRQDVCADPDLVHQDERSRMSFSFLTKSALDEGVFWKSSALMIRLEPERSLRRCYLYKMPLLLGLLRNWRFQMRR